MLIKVLETKFELEVPKERMLVMAPVKDMHYIEEMEAHYDKIEMPYALVECTNKREGFLGWSLITQLPLWND